MRVASPSGCVSFNLFSILLQTLENLIIISMEHLVDIIVIWKQLWNFLKKCFNYLLPFKVGYSYMSIIIIPICLIVMMYHKNDPLCDRE